MTRRRWLGGALVVGLAVVGAGLVRARGYAKVEGLRTLAAWEFAVLDAVIARMVLERTDATRFADQFLADAPARDRRDCRHLFAFIEQLAPLRCGYLSRFTRLDPAAQDAVLTWLERAPLGQLRGAFQVLKSLSMMGFYRDAGTWPSLGYTGPAVAW